MPAAASLETVGGDTYANMCSYLGLPTSCTQLLDKPGVMKLVKKWKSNEKLKDKVRRKVFILSSVDFFFLFFF